MNEELLKNDLRARFKTLRRTLKTPERDEAIRARVLEIAGASFFVYSAFGSEVATAGIIEDLLSRGAVVCLPKCREKEMKAVRYTGGALYAGAFGILEPEGEEDELCAVALVPLIAVDKRGNRLGYGGGYYDRYFKTHPTVYKIGLCYKEQIVDELPVGEYDIPLDAIVCEEGITFCAKT